MKWNLHEQWTNRIALIAEIFPGQFPGTMIYNLDYRDELFWYRQAKKIKIRKEKISILQANIGLNGSKENIQNHFNKLDMRMFNIHEDENKGPIQLEKIREFERKTGIILDTWPDM